MTTNVDRAAEVIDAWTKEGHELNSYVGSPHDIARRLSDAGLLAPDLPKPYLHPVTAWQATCSLCGYVQDDYGDFTALSAVGVVEEVLAGGWVLEGDRLVCDLCQGTEADHPHRKHTSRRAAGEQQHDPHPV